MIIFIMALPIMYGLLMHDAMTKAVVLPERKCRTARSITAIIRTELMIVTIALSLMITLSICVSRTKGGDKNYYCS